MQHYIGREELNAFTRLLRPTILCQSAFKMEIAISDRVLWEKSWLRTKVGGANADDLGETSKGLD